MDYYPSGASGSTDFSVLAGNTTYSDDDNLNQAGDDPNLTPE